MWAKVKKILLGQGRLLHGSDGQPLAREIQLAAAAVLLEVAAGDTEFTKEEQQELIRDLAFEFGTSKRKAAELIEDADEIRMTHNSLAPVVQYIRGSLSQEQRIEVMSLAWRIAEVDEEVGDFERVFTESLVPLLGLSEEQAQRAKERSREYIKEGSQ